MKVTIYNLFKIFIRNLDRYKWFILGLIIYLLYFLVFHEDEPNCLIKRTIGFPCPLCGMTRSVASIFTFHFKEAFYYHPFIIFVPLLFIVMMFRGIKQIDLLFHSKVFWIIILIVFLGIYLIRMILYFPDIAPMDYYYQAWISILQ